MRIAILIIYSIDWKYPGLLPHSIFHAFSFHFGIIEILNLAELILSFILDLFQIINKQASQWK